MSATVVETVSSGCDKLYLYVGKALGYPRQGVIADGKQRLCHCQCALQLLLVCLQGARNSSAPLHCELDVACGKDLYTVACKLQGSRDGGLSVRHRHSIRREKQIRTLMDNESTHCIEVHPVG